MSNDISQALNKLQKELEAVANIEEDRINLFTAVGMAKQEVKHSSFFAWLLNPEKPHRLKDSNISALEKFFARLYDFKPKEMGKTVNGKKVKDNEEVLKTPKHSKPITSKAELLQLLYSKVKLITEKPIVNPESQIDIRIDLPDTKTVVIIENKVESKAHTNQLQRYQDEVNDQNSEFKDYDHKIYIFLSPFGELPKNIGGDEEYNDEYCIFDYRQICKVAEDIINELKTKNQNIRMINILEDYIDMCKTNIFHENPEAFELCRKIMSDDVLRSAFNALTDYANTAVEEKVLEHCCRELTGNKDAAAARYFYTPAMKNYFERHKEDFTGSECRCVCLTKYQGTKSAGNQKLDGYTIYVELTTEKAKKWTTAQNLLIAKLGVKKHSQYTRIVKGVTLLTAEECREPWDKILPKLNKQLGEFKTELAALENVLNML